jgi:hypothetical protein
MKQFFLPLALLTSGFIYSADQNSQNPDLTKLTLAGLNLTSEEIGLFTKIANFRGIATLNMESPAIDTFYNLIKSDEKIRHGFSMTGPGKAENIYGCDVTLVKRDAGELIKGEDGEERIKRPAFHFELEVKDKSLLGQVIRAAFEKLRS